MSDGKKKRSKRKTPAYKAPFVLANFETRAGRQFKGYKRMTRGTNKLLALVIKRAKEETGWSWPQLAYYVRIGKSPNTINYRAPGILKNADMNRIRYDKYIAIAGLAGIPRAVAAVLYAKSFIPEEFKEDREYIGLCMKYLSPINFPAKTPEKQQEAFDMVKDAVPAAARDVPDGCSAAGMKQVYSGMPLTAQKKYPARYKR